MMSAPPTKRRPPRLNHKKSKTGCLRCKQRRVKCDEKHPVCGGCERHEVPCIFANTATDGPSLRTSSVSSMGHGHDDAFHINNLEPAESRGRRLEELKLLHTWTTVTTLTLPGADQPIVRDTWAVSIVPLALEHPPLLYAILSLSAFHLSTLEAHNAAKHTTTARRYLVLSLRHHNAAISVLNAANADSVCLTCILISVLTFRNLGTSYVPETSMNGNGMYRNAIEHAPFSSLPQRLTISHGTGHTFREAWAWIKDSPLAKSGIIVKAAPQYSDFQQFPRIASVDGRLTYPRDFAEAYAHLLDPSAALGGPVESHFNDPGPMTEELWDHDIRGAYEEALAHVGAIHNAIEAREPPLTICRRLMGFPALLPQRFIDLVQECRPRAMVILAHFFAAAKTVEGVWWVGDAGRLEVRSIWDSLPERWKSTMGFPMRMVHEGVRTYEGVR